MSCAILLVSGCATKIIDTYCVNSKEIIWDSMTELNQTPKNITKQIVENNLKIESICK